MKDKLMELCIVTEEMRKWQRRHQDTKSLPDWIKKVKCEKYVDRLLLEINELENGKESNNKA